MNNIELILKYKELIENDPTNDFFIFPLIAMVLNLTDENKFITDEGIQMLHNSIDNDFKIINEDPHNPSQKALTRICLYFSLIHNLIKFFNAFVCLLGEEQGSIYANKLPIELIEFLRFLNNKVTNYNELTKVQLDNILPRLTDKYATIFNRVKRNFWTKDIYQEDVVKIPMHPNDLPDGFKSENCINVSK